MTTLYYPTDLPCPLLPVQTMAGEGRLRTRMGTGHAKMRRMTTRPSIPATMETVLNLAQLARFHSFFNDETGGGVLPFYIKDPQLHGAHLLDEDYEDITDEDDEPLLITAYWLVTFGDQPPVESRMSRTHWRVGLDLERLP